MGNYYSSQIQFGPQLTPTVKIIIIINSVIFLLQNFIIPENILKFFFLSKEMIHSFHLYQFLTYGFFHANFMHILMNMLTLWMFGSEIEEHWGKKKFLILYVSAIFLGGIFAYLRDVLLPTPYDSLTLGASGGVYGLLIAYAFLWPDRQVLFMMIFPVKIKYLVMLLMLIIAFSQPGGNISHSAHLGGAAAGLLVYLAIAKYRFNFDWSYNRYVQRQKMKKYQEEMYSQINIKDKVDELLDKISKKGMNSLTKKERDFLKEASDKYYKE